MSECKYTWVCGFLRASLGLFFLYTGSPVNIQQDNLRIERLNGLFIQVFFSFETLRSGVGQHLEEKFCQLPCSKLKTCAHMKDFERAEGPMLLSLVLLKQKQRLTLLCSGRIVFLLPFWNKSLHCLAVDGAFSVY